MVSFSWSLKTVALRWFIFFFWSSMVTFDEYYALYLKQLGFTATQIGLTTLGGAHLIFFLLIGVLADRYRARKLVLLVCLLVLILLSLAPLTVLPKIIHGTCDTTPSDYLNNGTNDFLNTTLWVKNISDLSLNTYKNAPSLKYTADYSVISVSDNQSFLLNRTGNPLKRNAYISSYSFVFLLMVLIKGLSSILYISTTLLYNVAVMTHLKKERAKYGSYIGWGQIGSCISLFAVGMIASYVKNTVCGQVMYGYFVVFPFVAITMSFSLVALPWIYFEYLEHRVINWAEVKSVVFSRHYMFILLISFYAGCCNSFQYYWEYWYIATLSGSPKVMAAVGLIHRPLAVIWFFLAGKLINIFGDLRTVAIALFIFAVCEISLSFLQQPWLILVIEFFQPAAFAFGYSAINVHFSKTGSKASSAVVLGLAELTFSFGLEAGGTVMGLFFSLIGAKTTLFYNSIATTVILALFTAYLMVGKVDEYEHVDDID